jgi:hypothetical protein
MNPRRSKSRLTWAVIAIAVVGGLLWFSEQAMTWLRVTIHGR